MLLLFIFAAVVLFVAWLIGYLCWVLWKKGPYGRVAAVAIAGLVTYQIVQAVFPSAAFYSDEFAYRTGIALPPSAKIIFKKASYPDFHGDYASEMLFEVSKEDFAWLELAVKINPPTGDGALGGMYLTETVAAYGKKLEPIASGTIRRRKSDQRGAWGLLNDGKTVYFWFIQT